MIPRHVLCLNHLINENAKKLPRTLVNIEQIFQWEKNSPQNEFFFFFVFFKLIDSKETSILFFENQPTNDSIKKFLLFFLLIRKNCWNFQNEKSRLLYFDLTNYSSSSPLLFSFLITNSWLLGVVKEAMSLICHHNELLISILFADFICSINQ